MFGRSMLILYDLHGLKYMGMRTYHMIYPLSYHPICQVPFRTLRQRTIFYPPMHTRYNDIGHHAARLKNIFLNLFPVNVVHHIGRSDFNAVCSISIIEQNNTKMILFYQQGIALIPFALIYISARMWNMQGVQHQNGAFQSFFPSVKTMIIRCKQHIKTGLFNSIQIFIGSTKRRITAIGLATQCHFQIGNSQVCRTYLIFYMLETRRIIIGCPYTGSLYLCLMLHQVSHKQQGYFLLRSKRKTKAQAEQYKELPHIKYMIYNVNNRQDKENIRKSQRYR